MLGALPVFRDLSTWSRWRVFLKAAWGEPLDAAGAAIFCQHTGRTRYAPPAGGFPEIVCIVGRQSGKSRIAGAIATTVAIAATQNPVLAGTYALLIAQDHRGAMRTLFRYMVAPFEELPLLGDLVTGKTADALALRRDVASAAYPCRPSAVRGLRACVVVCDELAFFRSSDGNAVDLEMLRALRPTLATTGGKLIIISSPYGQSGALWELDRRHFGRDDSPVLVWHATAPEMNPTLPADYLKRMEEDDPEAYRSEVLGEFRTGVSALFDPDALTACVADGVRERAPSVDYCYFAFYDAAGGSGRDRAALAIAHHDGERAVLDCLRAWSPPFNPSGIIAEAAELMKSYGVATIVGDRYAGGFPPEAFRAHGIEYVPSDRDRSAIYLDLLPVVNAGLAMLLDLPDLLRELRGLERHRGPTGRDRVDHRRSGHDDLANAAAGALTLAALLPASGIDAEPTDDELRALHAVFEAQGSFWLPADEVLQWPS